MLIASILLFAVALLAATHYATFAVAHRKGYDKASAEEVSLMGDDLVRYNDLLHRVLNYLEDLLVIVEDEYIEQNAKFWDDDDIYEQEARQYDEEFMRKTQVSDEELDQTVQWFREHNLIKEDEHVTGT